MLALKEKAGKEKGLSGTRSGVGGGGAVGEGEGRGRGGQGKMGLNVRETACWLAGSEQ